MNEQIRHVMRVAERPPVVMVRGEGSWLWDTQGKRYLDFVQGWAVNCLGHSSPVILDALNAQARRLINCSPAYYNEPMGFHLVATARAPTSILQQRRRGERGRDQAGPEMGQPPSPRRLRDHHDGSWVPRPHAGDDVGVGKAGVGGAVRAQGARLHKGVSRRHRSREAGGDAENGGGHARADPGRSGRVHGRR